MTLRGARRPAVSPLYKTSWRGLEKNQKFDITAADILYLTYTQKLIYNCH